jgi:hypothetical protein
MKGVSLNNLNRQGHKHVPEIKKFKLFIQKTQILLREFNLDGFILSEFFL